MGRDDDFEEYVAARWGRLVRSAVLIGCSPPEAEDLVQATLIRCMASWSRIAEADDRDAYVHRALINGLISTRRRRWTGERPTADLPERPAPDEYALVDDTDVVLRALDRLPQDQRTAVVLRYYSHLGEEQMADVLGVASGTVKSRLSRALKRLQDDPNLQDLRVSR
ncbi:MAG TPA: SigE family RNA polymerase sigma factor [Nocardioides sp.]|nr:SigE family RNA polymerase sigma factor [Nocardioides sp.]